MTDIAALDRLIEAVDAGEDGGAKWMDVALGRINGLLGMRAYRGSLDAAKALHEALLPGYTRDVDATAPECGIRVSIWSPAGPIVGVGDTEIEARAWLLAILRAHRAQIGGQ